MSNEKFKIYPVGYLEMKVEDKQFLELIIERNNFIITENIEIADIVLITNQYSDIENIEEIKDYCNINKIPVVKNLYEMCNIRYKLEIQEGKFYNARNI